MESEQENRHGFLRLVYAGAATVHRTVRTVSARASDRKRRARQRPAKLSYFTRLMRLCPSRISPCYPPANWRFCLSLSIAVLAIACWLLFFRLGHYPLWGDEADTAIFARGIARTGDTLAMIDHNLYAFHDGTLLKDLHGRYGPLAAFYLAAPFVGANGTSSLRPRIPFALCGLFSVAFMLYWMYRCRISTAAWIAISVALLCNVSFYLYCRQCRYYSLATLLTLVIAYLYLNWNGRWTGIIWLIAASILLMLTHYLPYAGLYAAMACDYLFSAVIERNCKSDIGSPCWALNLFAASSCYIFSIRLAPE